MRSVHWVMAAALAASAATNAAALEGEGLVAPDAASWPRWQGRLALGSTGPLFHPDAMNSDHAGLQLSAAGLLGDYYFASSLRSRGTGGGFRATSGLFLGSRSSALLWSSQAPVASGHAFNIDRRGIGGLSLASTDGGSDNGPVPYLGVGYTGIPGKGGWGFSADLGVMALGAGSAVKLGKVFTGNQSLDDALHDMRLSPTLQLGVSFSF